MSLFPTLLKMLAQNRDALINHQHEHKPAHNSAADRIGSIFRDQDIFVLTCRNGAVHRMPLVLLGLPSQFTDLVRCLYENGGGLWEDNYYASAQDSACSKNRNEVDVFPVQFEH